MPVGARAASGARAEVTGEVTVDEGAGSPRTAARLDAAPRAIAPAAARGGPGSAARGGPGSAARGGPGSAARGAGSGARGAGSGARVSAASAAGGVAGFSAPDLSRDVSAVDALAADEIGRYRFLAVLALALAITSCVTLTYLPGEPFMTRLTWGAMIYVALGCAVLLYLTSRRERYSFRIAAFIWVTGIVAVNIAVVYFGVFSAAVSALSLGIYAIGIGRSRWLAMAIYGCSAVGLGAVAVLVLTGTVADPGLIRVDAPTAVLATLHSTFQFVLLSTLVMARASRRTTVAVVAEHAGTVRALGRREALLVEAREELDRALELGGTGRFTGQVLGEFRLGNLLGRGGMGHVYEAAHVVTGEPAAVKLLQPGNLGNRSLVMRFLREVEVASSLDVPNVVRVLAIGDASAPFPFLAMERLRGDDLGTILRKDGRMGATAVIELARQVGRGLSAAAAAGIVHRDIKPQNLFRAEQDAGPPMWKVLDFGVSKLLAAGATQTEGNVVGTPIYMAPEQAQGHEVDHRADLYGLGAVVYRCLTGHRPFRTQDIAAALYDLVTRMPARPGALADLPPEVDDVLLIAMAKQPVDRFGSAPVLVAALERALRGDLDTDLRLHARRLETIHPWRGAG